MTLMESGAQPVVAYVGIFNAVFLAIFIYATATATGGHLNPTITFTTVLCGLTPVPRGGSGRLSAEERRWLTDKAWCW
jgi:glycerol uptake facilitator-like aquaporin